MKRIFFFSLILVIPACRLFAQPRVTLTVFPELYTIDYGAFATVNDLRGAPRVFCAEILPPGVQVVLKGIIEWKAPEWTAYRQLGLFQTYPFVSRTLCNNDIGTTEIRISDYSSNSSLIEENIGRGKPTGSYKITAILMDPTATIIYNQDQKELFFLNPTQTLSIRTPRPGSEVDAGNVQIEWNALTGVENYFIKANVRISPTQTLEEALHFGTPLVNNRNVGNLTSINLRVYRDREWNLGDEIVIQVSANVSGPGGGQKLFSEIVNFRIFNPESPRTQILLNRLAQVLRNMGENELLQLLQSGQIDIARIVIRKEDGSVMSLEELIAFLEANPEAFLSLIRQ
jgi:hypothetical protein